MNHLNVIPLSQQQMQRVKGGSNPGYPPIPPPEPPPAAMTMGEESNTGRGN
jgi:hypothetical protein